MPRPENLARWWAEHPDGKGELPEQEILNEQERTRLSQTPLGQALAETARLRAANKHLVDLITWINSCLPRRNANGMQSDQFCLLCYRGIPVTPASCVMARFGRLPPKGPSDPFRNPRNKTMDARITEAALPYPPILLGDAVHLLPFHGGTVIIVMGDGRGTPDSATNTWTAFTVPRPDCAPVGETPELALAALRQWWASPSWCPECVRPLR